MYTPSQETFSWFESAAASRKSSRTGAFTDNMKLPIHRWLRYSAGFSAEWVQDILRTSAEQGDGIVFDPFAGSGTSLIAAQALGLKAAGTDAHPFVYRIAKIKSEWNVDTSELKASASQLLEAAKVVKTSGLPASGLLQKCYNPEVLTRLDSLRIAYANLDDNAPSKDLLWLAITAILRECSGVGTAQWQYVLPNKTKAKVSDPYEAFARRVAMFCADIDEARIKSNLMPPIELIRDDARTLSRFAHLAGRVTSVVTSPPYPNNYDYADATRLEMTFWQEIEGWSDLQRAVRRHLVRSCSQHSAAEKLRLDEILSTEILNPIRDELSTVCRELAAVRETKGGKKTYHTMVAAYFLDLALTWRALRSLCAAKADICFVIGDSAPYGVYVPVDKWFTKLALAEGFSEPRFDKIRDRNLKWKNRKHTVPLKEGILWLKG